MDSPKANKKAVIIKLDEDFYYKLMELHISPASVAKRALRAEVRRVQERLTRAERESGLRAVQRVDPRVTDRELKSGSYRIRRLRRMASVYEPSIGV
jgi:hypothetical protein